ncbi:hypothetical protein [Alcanivorax sp. DG881]|uniref:DUF7151 family protein n=1 Tax=Alcanivorax sp. DG881 TaxID=236097 RepID=UPI0002EC6EBC|nr:hypothetical protein [Alcanivorax sp. DG881]
MKKQIGGNMKGIKLLLMVTAASLVACGGGGGGSSAPSTQQATPKPDQLSATVAKTAFASSEACPQGGVTIDQGIDANRNGVLDPDEIFETQQVCNGADGGDGVASLIRVDEIGAGAQCTYGGLKVSVGLDASDDGILDPAEVSQISYVCSVTASQTDGFSSLLDMEGEAAGANCTAGGQKITSGLDFNRNGALDIDEVTQIKYICNGDTPVVYQTLINTSNVASNAQCPNGGVQIDVGLDVDQSSILEGGEVTDTSYLCNGQDGEGSISLVNVEDEPAGTNCSAGGKAIQTGIDSNQNNTLDPTEVMATSYVCNGLDGANGAGTVSSNYFTVNTLLGSAQQIECYESESYNRLYQVDYFSVNSDGTGTPYQTCYTETCSNYSMENGSRQETKSFGDAGCAQTHYVNVYCDDGYEWNGDICQSLTSVCPDGQVDTSRGCEAPVTSCLVGQKVEDNQCVNVDYVAVTGNICGIYKDPIKITSGQHFVTCDTSFNNLLLIEAGAILQVDRDWFILAKNGVQVLGNAISPVVIESSPNNLDGHWNYFDFAGDVYLDYESEQFIGDKVSYLQVRGYQGQSTLKGVGIAEAQIISDGHLTLDNVLSVGSYFDLASTSFRASFIIDSEVAGDAIPYIYGGLLASSVQSTARSLYLMGQYSGSAETNLNRPAVLFNGGVSVYCSTKAFVQGNASLDSLSDSNGVCITSDNETPLTNKYAIYILGKEKLSTSADQTVNLEAYIFDKNGLVQPTEITWKARYDVDGTYYDSGQTWTGRKVDISLSQKEQYEVYVESVNGQTDLLGPKSIILNVQ